MINHYLDIAPEVMDALNENRAVVALESTIISHGMPYPQNAETALRVEQKVRAGGAIPATMAILGGRLKAGLSPKEIDYLGEKGAQVTKVSRRDLPVLLASGRDGATTVASTMIISRLAGIAVFATGGIGGVHRGAVQTMDISADLQELARTNVAVVCAGAKSILDLKLTLEYLETYGVPVLGYQTDEFPAFYSRHSGLPVDFRVENALEIAKVMKAKWSLGLEGGLVIANPISEAYAMSGDSINIAISRAIAEADAKGIKGKALTPFLLSKIEALTGGKSLQANIQLVLNNAALAAALAVAYAGIEAKGPRS
ncbi:MAG: pseudouridine-5'-phosphate glycosidase [Phaeodactylibacter sp.]|nr:pseudouridine-5'-phosphate glycosidase [Phaeodactylibacter sp.]MCB0611647.1 pseudouridine-5'-phosphate glycosidase [Phaeodactylibacter sp.]